jgi:hypothetical protein
VIDDPKQFPLDEALAEGFFAKVSQAPADSSCLPTKLRRTCRLKPPNALAISVQQTMCLLQLPPEIIVQIFEYVGSAYFCSDMSRLTISKQWSRFAHTACYSEFIVTQKRLRRLLSSPYRKKSLSFVRDSMKAMDLELKGFDYWDSDLGIVVNSPGSVNDATSSPWSDGDELRRAEWTAEMNTDISHLAAATVQQARKLRILRIHASVELRPQDLQFQRRHYLFQSTICDLLSAGNLTSLEIDLCGTETLPDRLHQQEKTLHVCASIGSLLTTLRSLRLRMRHLCADVLKPPSHGTTLRLSKVLINLSLSNESPLVSSAAHARCCKSSSFLLLRADVEEQAHILVKQMAAPKMVRLLSHTLPTLQLQAFDVLTSETLNLEDGVEWDGKGEVVEQQWEDAESEISSLSWGEDD